MYASLIVLDHVPTSPVPKRNQLFILKLNGKRGKKKTVEEEKVVPVFRTEGIVFFGML